MEEEENEAGPHLKKNSSFSHMPFDAMPPREEEDDAPHAKVVMQDEALRITPKWRREDGRRRREGKMSPRQGKERVS